jgi:hypothetical protein
MAIDFSSGTQISAQGSSINIPGSVIQFIDNTTTVNTTCNTSAWVDILSTSITTSKAGNKIMVEYMCNHRTDQGNGAWCLVYHRILCNGSTVMSSGHMGAASNHIGFYGRTFLYTAASVGTYTFVASVLAHQGTANIGTAATGATNQYLRLYEIGT